MKLGGTEHERRGRQSASKKQQRGQKQTVVFEHLDGEISRRSGKGNAEGKVDTRGAAVRPEARKAR